MDNAARPLHVIDNKIIGVHGVEKPDTLQVGPYPVWDQEPLEAAYTVHRLFEAEDKPAFLKTHGHKIRAVAPQGDLGASSQLIEARPNLEIISIYGVGYDAVDFGAARSRRIRVTNTPDVLTRDVPTLALQ